MELKDYPSVQGKLMIQLFDENGQKYFEKEETNLVVTTGRQYIAQRMVETGRPGQMTHMEIGQGTTIPAAGDTAIQTVFTPAARVAISPAGGTPSGSTVTYSAIFPAGTGTGAVTEAAIFNASSAGTMLCRTTFPVVNKQALDTMAVSWTVSIIAS